MVDARRGAGMATLTVSVPDSLKEWIDEQVDAGEFATTNDYLLDLVDRDRELKDRERLEWLQRKVQESLASGISSRTTEEIFAEAVERTKARGTFRE
jgi:antitoxin ParD1/3/4